MDFDCSHKKSNDEEMINEWNLCRTENERANILKKSTFTLIPCMINENFVSTPVFLIRLYESLKYGAIPLILGADLVELPFSEVRSIYLRQNHH